MTEWNGYASARAADRALAYLCKDALVCDLQTLVCPFQLRKLGGKGLYLRAETFDFRLEGFHL